MPNYQRKDARAWAREHLVGCSAVTIPSYSADLQRLNEKGIRHDIALTKEFGYSYTLLCAEVAITPEENAQFTAWMFSARVPKAAWKKRPRPLTAVSRAHAVNWAFSSGVIATSAQSSV